MYKRKYNILQVDQKIKRWKARKSKEEKEQRETRSPVCKTMGKTPTWGWGWGDGQEGLSMLDQKIIGNDWDFFFFFFDHRYHVIRRSWVKPWKQPFAEM